MLHCAVESGAPLDFIKAIVNAYPEGVEMKDWKGRSVEEAALYDETKEFFRQYKNISKIGTDSIAHAVLTDDKINKVVRQVKKISNEVSTLEKSIQQLRKEMDLLIDELKKKT